MTCFVRLEGRVTIPRLRSALARVQRKHPALRALIREEQDGLYYEPDSAGEIPMRIVPRATEDDYRDEYRIELTSRFAYDEPQLRAVWLHSERESDLLLTTSHRICDGASIFILVREVLQSLYTDDGLIPYEPITVRDIIGDYQPPRPWKRKAVACLLNGLLRLIPNLDMAPEKYEYFLEWKADRALSDALKQRCRAEGVSVHAAVLVALDRALSAVFNKKSPKWIDSQIDPRRGRFAALKDDTLFLGGGSFKVRAGQALEAEFWSRARAINKEIPGQIDQEVANIPARLHFFEMLRPITGNQLHVIMRILYACTKKVSQFALSNLGNVVLSDSDAPFRVKDMRLYVHSFRTRALGWITYTFNGEMRFCCVSNEKCMSPSVANALKHEFMIVLEDQVVQSAGRAGEIAASTV
ncbi:MAG: hypothetical protein JO062_19180 [Bryobacterales bacterium]|nr:hypothetical protein [Bryobacterales bacterium]